MTNPKNPAIDNAQVTGLGDLGQYIQHKHNCTLGMRMGKECECGLTDTLARHRLERSEPVGWMPIDQCPMWELAIVTDGENVAKAQKAECDYGGHYWSIEPEDALEWEPTLWTPFPDTTPPEPVGWMGIESAPVDEQILAAIKVNHRNGDTWWERHIIVIDSETGTISDMDYHHGWEANDYEFWQPLPSAPGTTPPEPVAEIERLRSALREISDLTGEINPSNYDHDDACELNRQFCYAITVADEALKGASSSSEGA